MALRRTDSLGGVFASPNLDHAVQLPVGVFGFGSHDVGNVDFQILELVDDFGAAPGQFLEQRRGKVGPSGGGFSHSFDFVINC